MGGQKAAVATALICGIEEVTQTFWALLGVKIEPGTQLETLRRDLTNDLSVYVISDYKGFLQRIIDMDEGSIQEKRDGRLMTPAPMDFVQTLKNAEQFMKGRFHNDFMAVRPRLIEALLEALDTLEKKMVASENLDYQIAVINNTFDGITTVSEVPKVNKDLLDQADEAQLKQAWIRIQRTGIDVLSKRVLLGADGSKDDAEFKNNFYDKIQTVRGMFEKMQGKLTGPLIQKVETSFCRRVLPKYIR
jgi:hypothetical protein